MAVEAAPAKINLALHVLGRRPDSFHELESLVVFTQLADEITIVSSQADTLAVAGPFASSLKPGEVNLATRALDGFRKAFPGEADGPLAISIEKRIPVAAGLGGGSADAAAVLRALAGTAGIGVDDPALLTLAVSLGADVPVCLDTAPALVRGKGERIKRLPSIAPVHLVLVNPHVPMPTAHVFRALERRDNEGLPPADSDLAHAATLGIWLRDTRNDLEPAAIRLQPEIAGIGRAVAATRGCIVARMSGSGATIFGVYGTGAEAGQAAQELRSTLPDCWVAATPILT